MNDNQVPNEAARHANEGAASYCQNCGKRLQPETARIVGPSVFCEPCLAARLAGGNPAYAAAPAYDTTSYSNSNGGGVPWSAAPLPPGSPNPLLAVFLGFIPGVGAMYNAQYAKGIVHLIVFAVLVTLTSDANGVFGIFIAGWEFYMAFEAYHTAKARLDGTPLPNPFGLNDIGERFGFGKAWPAAATSSAAYASPATPPPPPGDASSVPPPASTSNWGAPTDGYASAANYEAQAHAAAYGAAYSPAYSQPQAYAVGVPVPSYGGPYIPPYSPVPLDPALAARSSQLPMGAILLIGLGTLFLLATTGIFSNIRGEAIVGLGLLGLASWLFVRRMMETGAHLGNDGTATYPLRVFRALRVSAWIALIGLLMLLHTFYILRWSHSWPFLIILAGVMTLLERTLYTAPSILAPAMPGAHAATPDPAAPPSTTHAPEPDLPGHNLAEDRSSNSPEGGL